MKPLLLVFMLALVSPQVFGGVWERQCVDSTGSGRGEYQSMALDSRNNVHFCYRDFIYGVLVYATNKSGSWVATVIDSSIAVYWATSIVIDWNDRPHISYKAEYLHNYYGLKHAELTDSGWVSTLVDSSLWQGQFGRASSIAIDSSGYPCISYLAEGVGAYSSHTNLKYAYRDAQGWHRMTLKTLDDKHSQDHTHLVISPANEPYIAFFEGDITRIYAAHLPTSSSTWEYIQVPDSMWYGWTTSYGFDIDRQGRLHFAFGSRENYLWRNLIRYRMYDGQGWIKEDADAEWSWDGVSLRVDRQGVPCMAVVRNSVRYLRREGSTWKLTYVDNTNIDPYSPCPLAFDSSNHPYIGIEGRSQTYRMGIFCYRYWPGNPSIELASTSHDFDVVWTQSYADWDCVIRNRGDAPLIVARMDFWSSWSKYSVMNFVPWMPIFPQDSASLTIRFQPPADGQFPDSLLITTNDLVHPVSAVYLTGTGSSSGRNAIVAVKVLNCSYDSAYGTLVNRDIISGAAVALYRGTQLSFGPQQTGVDGIATLTNVRPDSYTVHIAYGVTLPHTGQPSTLGIRRPAVVGPGSNSLAFVLPADIVLQKYESIYKLRNLPAIAWDTTYLMTYPSEAGVESMLSGWSQDLPAGTDSSLARLIITEDVLQRMSVESGTLFREFVTNIAELINVLFYSDSWLDSIVKIVKFLVKLFTEPLATLVDFLEVAIKTALMTLIGDAIDQVAAELPDVTAPQYGSVPIRQIVKDGWDAISAEYSGWNTFMPFEIGNWDRTKQAVFDKMYSRMFEAAYVDLLTDPRLDDARRYSQAFDYSTRLDYSYYYSQRFLASERSSIENVRSMSEDLRETAALFNHVGAILEIAGAIPGAGYLVDVASAVRYASYAELAVAIGTTGVTFFNIPDDLGYLIDHDIYGHWSAQGAPSVPRAWGAVPGPIAAAPNTATISERKHLLRSAADRYDSTLLVVRDLVSRGKAGEAFIAYRGVVEADRELAATLRTTCAPLYAVARQARDSVGSFPALYDSLIRSYARAGEGRIKTCVYGIALVADSSQRLRDSLIAQIDRSILHHGILTGVVSSALDTVSQLPMPGIVVATQVTQDQLSLKEGKTATITLRVQNIGAVAADSITLTMKTNSAIGVLENPNVFLGTLQPGQTTSPMSWTVALKRGGYTRGTWTASLQAKNAEAFSYSGAFVVPSTVTPGTGGRLSRETMYNYPNPFNPEQTFTTLRYSLAKSGSVTIKIYDAGGLLVRNLIDGVVMSGGDEQATQWNGRNGAGNLVANGVYFYVVESTAGERAVGKIAVIR